MLQQQEKEQKRKCDEVNRATTTNEWMEINAIELNERTVS
jgi:hypothetical protein